MGVYEQKLMKSREKEKQKTTLYRNNKKNSLLLNSIFINLFQKIFTLTKLKN